MGKTKRKSETIYIDHDKFDALDQLAKSTRIPRSVLWREALDDLLIKHGAFKAKRRGS
jgi:predicted transcriptional regulator